ncbi:MAG TPA: HAD family hydrolase [Fibrobacteria bacterium]|jgi:phosphoglycolate phosphatase-like HAD superfamily hydrolase|nr:HAD family hydrolase [Fibrobacteria bacterium]
MITPIPRHIFLDFDGVVMDSMALKLDAYCHALAEFGFTRAAVREQQLLYAGLSRARALPLMYKALSGGRELSVDAQARVLERFAEEDIRLRPRMTLMPGAEGFLEEAGRRGMPLTVVTGTPQEVVDGTVERFGLRRFFREVHGSPPLKSEHLAVLPARHGLLSTEALYVGDALQDINAAESAGIPFVAVDHGDGAFDGRKPIATVKGLRELPALLGWL